LKQPYYSCLLVFFLTSVLFSQINIDSITTDTINIFDQPTTEHSATNSSVALWSSLLLPGIGHQLSDRPKSALAYFSTDILSLFGAVLFYQLSIKNTQNSKALAYLHAQVADNASNEDYFWEIIGSFNRYNDYHDAYPTDMRVFSNKFIEEKYYWEWEDTLFRNKYVHLQKLSKQMSTISSFCIGAMVLNRLVAFIDLRSTSRNKRFTQVSSLSFTPIVNSSSKGIALSTSF
jgi:hypothetical protein